MALHVRSDTANEIEILVLRHHRPCCGDAPPDHGSVGATGP